MKTLEQKINVGVTFLFFLLQLYVVQPSRYQPVIGILQDKSVWKIDTDMAEYYLSANHVHLLRSGGAVVVPIKPYEEEEYYSNILSKINGVYFPGGHERIKGSDYAKALSIILKHVIRMNKEGTYFPMWTTCLGFHILATNIGKTLPRRAAHAKDMELPLNLTKAAYNSKLFGKAPSTLINILKTEKVSAVSFQIGITVKDFRRNKKLTAFFSILSSVVDRWGIEFVATIEARDFPIYGVAWHPEKEPFYEGQDGGLEHSAHAVLASQYIANFIVAEARKNNHSFSSIREETSHRIENYCVVLSPPPLLRHRFYFNRTSSTRKCAAQSFTWEPKPGLLVEKETAELAEAKIREVIQEGDEDTDFIFENDMVLIILKRGTADLLLTVSVLLPCIIVGLCLLRRKIYRLIRSFITTNVYSFKWQKHHHRIIGSG